MASIKTARSTKKPVQTVESKFVDQFGDRTLKALRVIAGVDKPGKTFSSLSLGAYRANLTRGAYKPFVVATKTGLGGSLKISK